MLKDKKIGFIGAGNMGSAIAGGLISSGNILPENILVTDIDVGKANEFAKSGATVLPDAKTLAKSADIVILAIKPQVYDIVLSELAEITNPLYISIAAGISIDFIKGFFSGDVHVIRVMPNTPALINEGMTVLSSKEPATEEDISISRMIFESIGLVEVMPEKYMDAVVAVSGSSPAYVYMMIEAMADAAVLGGIPRDIAYKLAAQSVAGSARMVLETKQHPGKLKDNVCSPAGTTICAVAKLEEDGFRSSIINAMNECMKRSKEISK
jgi:pyrroline-5-carboxylate reductase